MALDFTPFELTEPSAPAIALVCDSPHSGTHYPRDFEHAVPRELLRQGEDTHVDALWQAVPEVGGTLLAAHFPRTYIDANRTEDDIDPELLEQPWPTPLRPSEKTRLGYGLMTFPREAKQVRHWIELYRQAWREAGHPGNGRVMIAFHMLCAPSDAEAEAAAREPINAYMRSLVDANSDWGAGMTSTD